MHISMIALLMTLKSHNDNIIICRERILIINNQKLNERELNVS